MAEFIFHGKGKIVKKGNEKEVRFTVVAVPSGELVINKLSIGLAICSEKDSFARKKGRLIASGRANRRPYALLDVDPTLTRQELFGLINNFVEEVAKDIPKHKQSLNKGAVYVSI